MKAENRAKLRCSKHIKGSIYDSFTVVVSSGNVDAAKSEYERQGYTVFKL